jgi:hypothetical protein
MIQVPLMFCGTPRTVLRSAFDDGSAGRAVLFSDVAVTIPALHRRFLKRFPDFFHRQ